MEIKTALNLIKTATFYDDVEVVEKFARVLEAHNGAIKMEGGLDFQPADLIEQACDAMEHERQLREDAVVECKQEAAGDPDNRDDILEELPSLQKQRDLAVALCELFDALKERMTRG